MRLRAASACLAGLLALAPGVRASGRPGGWIELRTPHFRIVSNGREKQARRVGLELEQIRALLAQSLPVLQQQPESRLLVLALKDEASMRALVSFPGARQLRELPAGVFLEARERSCLLLRLDQDDDTFHPAYHEYVHALLAHSLPRLPLWLAEGLAELYANAQFDRRGARLGGEGWQRPYLRGRFLMPLETLRTLAPTSRLYQDPVRAQLFYAQSWALIHFLIFGPGKGEGRRLNLYLALLRDGEDERKAFEESFGTLSQAEKELGEHLRLLALPVLHFKGLPPWDERSFDLRELPSDEWLALQDRLEIAEQFHHPALPASRP